MKIVTGVRTTAERENEKEKVGKIDGETIVSFRKEAIKQKNKKKVGEGGKKNKRNTLILPHNKA